MCVSREVEIDGDMRRYVNARLGVYNSVARYIERWMNINMHDSTEVSARKHEKQNETLCDICGRHMHAHTRASTTRLYNSVARYIERWMNINMHDSTEVSARKHDKQNTTRLYNSVLYSISHALCVCGQFWIRAFMCVGGPCSVS
jgi:hypothetical protein